MIPAADYRPCAALSRAALWLCLTGLTVPAGCAASRNGMAHVDRSHRSAHVPASAGVGDKQLARATPSRSAYASLPSPSRAFVPPQRPDPAQPQPVLQPAAPRSTLEHHPTEERPPSPPLAHDPRSANRPARLMLLQLADAAVRRYATIENYACLLTRQERVGDQLNPRETVRIEFRKDPWSIHLSWLEKPHRGREVIYVPGRYDDKIHGREPTLVGKIRLKLDPQGAMAQRESRYPITEAGIGSIIEKLQAASAPLRSGGAAPLKYLGLAQRPETGKPLHQVRHALEDGSTRDVYFDPETQLPILVETVDASGQPTEYYHFHELQPNQPQLQRDEAFDPSEVFS